MMHSLEFTESRLIKDPAATIDAKQGAPLSDADVAVIDRVFATELGDKFDRSSFVTSCLHQALLVARVGSGSLAEMVKLLGAPSFASSRCF